MEEAAQEERKGWDRRSVRLVFLGTSSGIPTPSRNMSAIAVHVPACDAGGGETSAVWLFDCGGGTQQQLLRQQLWIGHITRIFITHLHGDHCYDVVGLLALRSMRHISTPLQLIGPQGLAEFVHTTMRISQLYLSYPLELVELSAEAPTPPALNDARFSLGWQLTAVPIEHRILCFGYIFQETPPPPKFDASIARRQFQVPQALLKELARNNAITRPDGVVVTPEQCAGTRRALPRKWVILGDTHDASRILPVAMQCDLLVHEATFASAEEAKALQCGHSTPILATRTALALHAQVLILTHFSARYSEKHAPVTVADLLREAQEFAADAPLSIFAAEDFWHYDLPPHPVQDHARPLDPPATPPST